MTGQQTEETEGAGQGSASSMAPAHSSLNPHKWLIRTMLGLAAVLSVIAMFAVWANRQLLDTGYWTSTNTKLLENHAIQEELSSYLTDQLYANVNVAGEIRADLPSELRPLAGPAASGLRTVVEKGIVLALQQQRVQELWSSANQVAHKHLIELIENKNSVIRTPGHGQVYLDLRPIVAEMATRLGAPASTAEKIPSNIAQIKIANSKSLEAAQAIVRVLKALAVVLPVLVLLLFAGAIALARGRRPRTIVNVGLVCIGAGVVTLILRSIAGTQVVDTLATTEAVRPAASAAWSIGTSLLVDISVAMIFIGVFVVLAGLLAGGSRWARSSRRALAPWLRDRPDIVFGVVVVALLILFVWGPIEATRELAGILLITVLTLFATEMLRRQTAAEFPDVQPAGAGAGMEGVREGLANVGHSLARGGAAVRSGIAGLGGAGGSAGGSDQVDRLERLATLHASGALSDEEFDAAKRELLSSR
jgi:hypothetical protein